MKIVAFDLGTTWATAQNAPLGVDHATLTGKHRPEKMAAFAVALAAGHWEDFDLVVYERPFARGQAATRFLWGMAGILEAAAAPYCAIVDITPAEIKKWATGKGGSGKDPMLVAAACMGYTGDNEHEADAFCLLKYAEANLKSQGPENG